MLILFCMRGCGRIERPAFPAPSDRGGWLLHNSGASRREIVDVYLAVIARSEATKQSILSLCGTMDCFALLAMTMLGCLKTESGSNTGASAE
jgi:hypothetical protein